MQAHQFGRLDGTCSPLSPQHFDALLKRGLTPETIAAARLRSATAKEVADLLGFDPHSGGIELPFLNPISGEAVSKRIKPDIPPLINGKSAKYLSCRGASNYIYFQPGCAGLLQDASIPIGITEGEFKTLSAFQVGLLYVGLVGVYGFRGRNERGEIGPIPDLDLISWQDRVVTTTDVTRQTLNDLVNGHRGISPEMAIRLDKAFGGGADTWLRLQAAYDLAQAKEKGQEGEF